MSYSNDSWWGTVHAEKRAKKWRTELVKIGEEVLQEIEKYKVPNNDVIERFRNFVEEARSAGMNKL